MRTMTLIALALTLPLALGACSNDEADDTTDQASSAQTGTTSETAPEEQAESQEGDAPAAETTETSGYVQQAVDFARARVETANIVPFGPNIVLTLPANVEDRAGLAGEVALTMSNMAPDETLTLHVTSGSEPVASMPAQGEVDCTLTVSANTIQSNDC